jgi:hypothetical protein
LFYSVSCYPSNKKIDANIIEACSPLLFKAIKEFNPNSILLLGDISTKSVIKHLYKTNTGNLDTWSGWTIPSMELNTWICPTYNPLSLLNKNQIKTQILIKLFEEHLQKSIKLAARKPFKKIPNYEKRIKKLLNPQEIIKIINSKLEICKLASFDYETNCVKPEVLNSQIYSCSICFDEIETIAFPWTSSIFSIMKKFLKSPIKKIAANMKFEDKWTRYHLKSIVKNWYWDTMLASHIIDNRPATKSLKFQSFVHFGIGDYNSHIEPFFNSSKDKKINNIHKIDMMDLLTYNGLDSLLEFKLAKLQMKQLS